VSAAASSVEAPRDVTAWHALSADEACLRFEVDPQSGLGAEWGICLLGPIVYLAVTELGKLLDRRAGERRPMPAPAEVKGVAT
jgi:hypothetical protein